MMVPAQENPIAWDRYAYSANNPLSFIDPSGHFPWVPVILSGFALFGGYYAYCRYQSEAAINKNPEMNRAVRDQIGGALVSQLSDIVTEQAQEHSISSDLINAVIRHESGALERRYFGAGLLADVAEAGEAIARSLVDNGASIGIGQMQTGLAFELGDMGYAPKADSSYDITAQLLTPSIAVEYIAGNLEYLSDQLTSTYGEAFTTLDTDAQNRLILIGYNQGWENLKKNIELFGLIPVISQFEYDNQTLDEYRRWRQE